jgi:hypothetical protein
MTLLFRRDLSSRFDACDDMQDGSNLHLPARRARGIGPARTLRMAAGTLVVERPQRGRTRTTGAPRVRTDTRQAPLVLTIFFVVQLLDGILTYWGVNRFGVEMELNTLLAAGMVSIGPAATLMAAKLVACAGGLVLYASGYFRPLAAVAGLCLGLAVVPWLVFWFYTVHL